MQDFKKVVLITGCSSGIGFETALLFARQGYHVFASVRNLKNGGAAKLIEIAQQEKIFLEIIQLDVTIETSVTAAVNHVISTAGQIDVLVNNAGFGFLGAVEDFSIEEIKEQYETNIFGVFRMIKAVVPHMRTKKSGMIINLSSINGILSFPLYGIYSSSKFAIESISAALRFELSPFNIKVALVEPGVFASQFTQNRKHPKVQGTPESVYNPLTESFFKKLNPLKNVRQPILKKIWDPKRVAKKIYSLSQKKNPQLQNIIGIDAHLLLFFNHLPEAVKFWILQKFLYGQRGHLGS
jgi:NAD(P)-dependent dehydrogenase (short-subunit alcohol dehydrogenase family)